MARTDMGSRTGSLTQKIDAITFITETIVYPDQTVQCSVRPQSVAIRPRFIHVLGRRLYDDKQLGIYGIISDAYIEMRDALDHGVESVAQRLRLQISELRKQLPERATFDAAPFLDITDLKVGNRSQLVQAGAIPATMLVKDSPHNSWGETVIIMIDTVQTSQDLTIGLKSKHAEPIELTGVWIVNSAL